MQSDENLLRCGCHAIRMSCNGIVVLVHNLVILLHEPHNDVARFRQGKLLPQTDPGPTVERKELPSGLPANPALGLELVGVGAPDVLASVHRMNGVVDFFALPDVDRGKPVRAAASGKGCVFGGAAAIDWDVGVEPEDFGEGMLQVCAGFEVGECDAVRPLVGAEAVQDNAPKLVIDIWMTDKDVEGPAK